MWIFDQTGRKGTQVHFCPFCGKPALNIEHSSENHIQREIDRTQIAEVSNTGNTIRKRQWMEFKNPELIYHKQYGNVLLLAHDFYHARVKNTEGITLTVVYENLIPIKADKETTKKPKVERTESLIEKYSTTDFMDLI